MSKVEEFEQKIAEFFGAPYAVATDSCTHGIELCLRLAEAGHIACPRNTYLSVPMLAQKLGITLLWKQEGLNWKDYYNLYASDRFNIFDAAVLWERNSYLKGSMMCISFQYAKHLSIGRAGMILLGNEEDAIVLKKMSYDGRLPDIPWREQNIEMMGYHYYLQPELAEIGLQKLPEAIKRTPRQWSIEDWPDLTQMEVFR